MYSKSVLVLNFTIKSVNIRKQTTLTQEKILTGATDQNISFVIK